MLWASFSLTVPAVPRKRQTYMSAASACASATATSIIGLLASDTRSRASSAPARGRWSAWLRSSAPTGGTCAHDAARSVSIPRKSPRASWSGSVAALIHGLHPEINKVRATLARIMHPVRGTEAILRDLLMPALRRRANPP